MLVLAGEITEAQTDAWKDGLRRAIALNLGIAAWRLIIDNVRAGSVEVTLRIIDTADMGNVLSAADSADHLEKLSAKGSASFGAYSLADVTVKQPPSPPPSAPGPDPCERTDADAFFNASLGCTSKFSSTLWTLRATIIVVVGGGVLVFVLIGLLWKFGYDADDKKALRDPFKTGKYEEQKARWTEFRNSSSSELSKKEKRKIQMEMMKAKAKHPVLTFWRSSMSGASAAPNRAAARAHTAPFARGRASPTDERMHRGAQGCSICSPTSSSASRCTTRARSTAPTPATPAAQG